MTIEYVYSRDAKLIADRPGWLQVPIVLPPDWEYLLEIEASVYALTGGGIKSLLILQWKSETEVPQHRQRANISLVNLVMHSIVHTLAIDMKKEITVGRQVPNQDNVMLDLEVTNKDAVLTAIDKGAATSGAYRFKASWLLRFLESLNRKIGIELNTPTDITPVDAQEEKSPPLSEDTGNPYQPPEKQ